MNTGTRRTLQLIYSADENGIRGDVPAFGNYLDLFLRFYMRQRDACDSRQENAHQRLQ